MKNKVSIVTISYNAEKEIERTLNSVISQTYDNIQYVIIDGESTDDTLNIIKKYKDKINVIISEPDKGIYNAMNKSLDYCDGEWVIFMNAGDCFVDTHVLSEIFNNRNLDDFAVIFGFTLTSKGLMPLKPFVCKAGRTLQMGFCHQSSLVRRNIIKKFRFDERYKIAADYNLMFRIWNAGYHFYNSGITIAYFDTSGLSSKKQFVLLEEIASFTNLKGTLRYYLFYMKLVIKKLLLF